MSCHHLLKLPDYSSENYKFIIILLKYSTILLTLFEFRSTFSRIILLFNAPLSPARLYKIIINISSSSHFKSPESNEERNYNNNIESRFWNDKKTLLFKKNCTKLSCSTFCFCWNYTRETCNNKYIFSSH